jgi:transposase
MVNEHSDYTLSEYCEYWEEKTGVRLSASAMCRFLKKQNLTLKKKHSGVVRPQQNRDDWIRTSGPFVPNEVRYQAAPHPATKTQNTK